MVDNSSIPPPLFSNIRAAGVFLVAVLFFIPVCHAQHAGHGNSAYDVTVKRNGAVEILHRASRVSGVFRPEFYVLYSASDPKLHMSFVNELRYWVPAWTNGGDLFQFHDYRRNIICSLNETIGNMIAYAMNDVYAGWNADLKASDYATDVKNTVKVECRRIIKVLRPSMDDDYHKVPVGATLW